MSGAGWEKGFQLWWETRLANFTDCGVEKRHSLLGNQTWVQIPALHAVCPGQGAGHRVLRGSCGHPQKMSGTWLCTVEAVLSPTRALFLGVPVGVVSDGCVLICPPSLAFRLFRQRISPLCLPQPIAQAPNCPSALGW